MKKQKPTLSKKEKLFCLYFVNSLDAQLSAKEAGYTKHPNKKGQALLLKSGIADEIERLKSIRERAMQNSAVLGLEKLAFSSVCDAVSLLYMDSPQKEELEKMDLFMVQEIKRPRDGAVEIKFFDRFKALEKLCGLSSASTQTGSLMDAIKLGAENLLEKEDKDGV